MKRRDIIILLTLLILSTRIAYTQDSLLQLTIESDKVKYTVGEVIELHCSIKNISDTTVVFYTYDNNRVSMQDMSNRDCLESQKQTMVDFDSLASLKPNEVYTYSLKGHIAKDTGVVPYSYSGGILRRSSKKVANSDSAYYKVAYGVFVNFPRADFFIKEDYGRYKITSHLFDESPYIHSAIIPKKDESNRQYKTQYKWRGQLTSNTIVIEILK